MLDEPSANLDPRARRELLEVLARIERTMLVTTHDLPLAAELCERAVILAAGRVVADGAVPTSSSPTPSLLAAHDLELPAGFDLARIERRPRPGRPAPLSLPLDATTRRSDMTEPSTIGRTLTSTSTAATRTRIPTPPTTTSTPTTSTRALPRRRDALHPHTHAAGEESDHAHRH